MLFMTPTRFAAVVGMWWRGGKLEGSFLDVFCFPGLPAVGIIVDVVVAVVVIVVAMLLPCVPRIVGSLVWPVWEEVV